MAGLRTTDEIAKACGCSPGLVSRMRKQKGMPYEFASAEEALGWYTRHRERRPREDRSGARVASTTATVLPPIDAATLQVAAGDDFESVMVRHSEAAVLQAYALYDQAVRAGADDLIPARLKNWSDAAKQAGEVRARFQDLQVASRRLIRMDEVEFVVGAVVRLLASDVARVADRCATAANPQAPEVARAAIGIECDRVLAKAASAAARVASELQSGARLPQSSEEPSDAA